MPALHLSTKGDVYTLSYSRQSLNFSVVVFQQEKNAALEQRDSESDNTRLQIAQKNELEELVDSLKYNLLYGDRYVAFTQPALVS